jgi:hypothetical protein
MTLTLADVRRIASDIAQQQHPSLEVIGVTTREGSSTSAEVILAIRDCYVEPYRVVISMSRQISEAECRMAVLTQLGEHLAAPAIGRASAEEI